MRGAGDGRESGTGGQGRIGPVPGGYEQRAGPPADALHAPPEISHSNSPMTAVQTTATPKAGADLDLAQAALLAGIPQAPAGLDPLVHPAAARARQAVVLQAMVAAGDATPEQARAAAQEPLVVGVMGGSRGAADGGVRGARRPRPPPSKD